MTAKTRKMMPKTRMLVMGVMAATMLGACTTERQTRGFMADYQMIDAVTPGIDNINSVRELLGKPSITGTFDDSIWYYISTETVTKSIFHEQPQTHLVMAVQFDSMGVVSDITRYGLEDIRPVNPVNDKTPTRGRELGFFEQIFGNIGRFAAPAPGEGGSPF